jgi:serine protease AprX
VAYITFDTYALLCGSSVGAANSASFQGRYKLTGKGVGIGIIDSGVFPHPDLLNPQNKIIRFTDYVNNLKYPYDDNGHGTFISGLLCGSGVSSKGMYRGIAESGHIYASKAFNSLGKGAVSSILKALEEMIQNSSEYNLKVICLPFEIIDNDYFILSLFEKLFLKAVEKDIVIVIPAGHNGSKEGSIRGIATLNNCLTVGGLDTNPTTAVPYNEASSGPFGKFEKPDLAAAAVDLCSLNSDTGYISERNGKKIYPPHISKLYTSYTGTSCAAGYIAGVCALLFENNAQLKYKDLVSLLKVSSRLLNMNKWHQGSGVIDLERLLP